LVIPATVKVAAALLASAHEAPKSVIVATFEEPEPLAVQLVKPLVTATVGDAGTVVPDGKVTVIVWLAFRAPVELAVKPLVQVAVAAACRVEALKVTLFGLVAAQIVTFEVFAAVVSVLVLTLKVPPNRVLLAGFVIPSIVKVAAVLPASEHDPPLLASVIVTVVEEVEPVAEQLLNPLVSAIAGVAGIVKAELKTTVIESPSLTFSAPVELEVNPTVQVESAPPVCGEPPNVTLLAPVAAPMITFEGDAACVSVLVLTPKVRPLKVLLAGFVIPAIFSVAAVLPASAQVPPLLASVITATELPMIWAVAVQFVKPLVSVIAASAGIVNEG
jgi:hypothetical protein